MWPRERTASIRQGSTLMMPEASSIDSPGRGSHGGGFHSLRPPPEGAFASMAAPLPSSIALPSPVFLSRHTIRRSDDARQIRLLPQERYPPPIGPPPRAVASPSRPLPRAASSPQSAQTGPISDSSTLEPAPPQQSAATMEQNPQLPLVPSTAPMTQEQEALRFINALHTGTRSRADDLRQPRQLPSTEGQTNHRVVQGRQLHPWFIPGREIVPPAPNDLPIKAQRTTEKYLWIQVGGKRFKLPMHLLSDYPFWSALTVFEPPPQGWSIPHVNFEIFTILIECVYTEFGFHGTEIGLSLIKLCCALILAKNWGMRRDERNLRNTTYRYIVRRILGYNPNVPEDCRDLDYRHHQYRSEELYRGWKLSVEHPSIQKMLTEHDMIALYCCVIPEGLWPALTARFNRGFVHLLNVSAAARRNSAGVASGVDYRRWWLHYYHLAGYRDASWLSLDAQHRLFAPQTSDENKSSQERAEFEAARARGNALVNAFEVQQAQEQPPVTSTTPVTPVTPVIPVTPVTPVTPGTANTSSSEESDNALQHPTPRRHQETRRVRFAESTQVMIISPQTERIQMNGHDSIVDSLEQEVFHGEASRAA
ncbi:hypothetical protein HDV63DRAFT_397132 [Trichoderma sp. SZMC 28014]